ncbi:nuclear mRNA export, poly(A)+RNA binding protein [Blastocladiella emersonii ATCC 22665]|nr:nuclear mRNA export, poly(A)+RNA binding protein [Blastocladiella emersonii ATCC 22665]
MSSIFERLGPRSGGGSNGGGGSNNNNNSRGRSGGSSGGSAGRGRGSYSNSAASAVDDIPPFSLSSYPPGAVMKVVSNLPHDFALRTLTSFLVNRANPRVEVLDSAAQGTSAYFILRTPPQGESFQRLNNISFSGARLTIATPRITEAAGMGPRTDSQMSLDGGAGAAGSASTALLLELVQRRYDTAAQFLDLSGFADDQLIRKWDLNRTGVIKILPFIYTPLLQRGVPVRGISLANNRIGTLGEWGELLCKFPTLESLDLSRNNITGWNGLDAINSTTHPALTALNLRDNPLQTTRARTNASLEQYRSQAKDRFPRLASLDGEALIVFAVASPEETMLRVSGSLIAPDIQPLVFQFVNALMHAMDTNRPALLPMYHPEAVFSVVTLGSNVSRYDQSRNLAVVTESESRFTRLRHGPQAILAALQNCPRTSHVVESLAVDAWAMPALAPGAGTVIAVFIRGEFKELERTSSRARHFDRSMMLLRSPTDPNSCHIIQDQWTVRAAANTPLPWILARTQEAAAAAAPPAPVAPALPPKPAGMSDADYQLVLVAMQQAGLSFDGAIECLRVTKGDVSAILAAKAAGQIPPALFLHP